MPCCFFTRANNVWQKRRTKTVSFCQVLKAKAKIAQPLKPDMFQFVQPVIRHQPSNTCAPFVLQQGRLTNKCAIKQLSRRWLLHGSVNLALRTANGLLVFQNYGSKRIPFTAHLVSSHQFVSSTKVHINIHTTLSCDAQRQRWRQVQPGYLQYLLETVGYESATNAGALIICENRTWFCCNQTKNIALYAQPLRL